jgi:hypothetical protein
MEVLEILADPSRHPKIDDEELYTFLNQFLVKHKSFNILSTSQEAAVCAAIKRRYQNTPPPPKTRDLVNKLDQQRTSEEDKKASFVDLFRRAGWSATASVDSVKDMFRRKGVANGNAPLTELDIVAVLKYMSSTFSDFDARQEQSWSAENFGKVTAQLVLSPVYLANEDAWIGLGCHTCGVGSIKFSFSRPRKIQFPHQYLSSCWQCICFYFTNATRLAGTHRSVFSCSIVDSCTERDIRCFGTIREFRFERE